MSSSSSRLGGNGGNDREEKSAYVAYPHSDPPHPDRKEHETPGGCSWPAGGIGLAVLLAQLHDEGRAAAGAIQKLSMAERQQARHLVPVNNPIHLPHLNFLHRLHR